MFIMPNEAWSAILGAAVASWITYRFAVTLSERQFEQLKAVSKLDAWNVAAREFIGCFAGELAALEANSDALGDVMEFLRRTYTTHAAAVAAFAEYLPVERRDGLRAAWLQHCYDGEDPNDTENPKTPGLDHDSLLFLHYSNEFNLANRSSARVHAIQGIRALLAFAKDA